MAGTLIERAWTWLHATFPERQIYIRSQGRVQFFTFGSSLQATCAGLSLILLGWMAFASVNVIFKDHIIAAKDHRFQQMQGTYENRVADLQLSYDELNNALVSAEDRFKTTADQLEAKQQNVARLLNQKQVVDMALSGTRKGEAPLRTASARVHAETASDSVGGDASIPATAIGAIPATAPSGRTFSGSGASQLNVMPDPVEPQPTSARPARASMLGDGLLQFAQSLFEREQARPQHAAAPVNNSAVARLNLLTDRLARLSSSENTLLAGLDNAVSTRIADVKGVLGRVGLNPVQAEKGAAMGGPLVPMQAVELDGVSDPGFTQAYQGTLAHTAELETLFSALRHVPLTTPVHGGQFEVTSGFGPRVDPFTGHLAFHPGVDFAGPWGSTVAATAPGTVVYAGPHAGYGNLVEIDHGYGFHTRYGHLSSVLVRTGSRVEKGTPVGRLGSTGRSTGPHVHYEVWLASKLRDPARYIETGRHVTQ